MLQFIGRKLLLIRGLRFCVVVRCQLVCCAKNYKMPSDSMPILSKWGIVTRICSLPEAPVTKAVQKLERAGIQGKASNCSGRWLVRGVSTTAEVRSKSRW